MGLCCGVFRSWFAQGAMCFSSGLSSFFFSKSSKFLERNLAFCSISFMSRPTAPEFEALAGGGSFFLGSFPPRLVCGGSVLAVPEVSCVLGERIGGGGCDDATGAEEGSGAEMGMGGAPGRCWGMEEVGRGGGAPLA